MRTTSWTHTLYFYFFFWASGAGKNLLGHNRFCCELTKGGIADFWLPLSVSLCGKFVHGSSKEHVTTIKLYCYYRKHFWKIRNWKHLVILTFENDWLSKERFIIMRQLVHSHFWWNSQTFMYVKKKNKKFVFMTKIFFYFFYKTFNNFWLYLVVNIYILYPKFISQNFRKTSSKIFRGDPLPSWPSLWARCHLRTGILYIVDPNVGEYSRKNPSSFRNSFS